MTTLPMRLLISYDFKLNLDRVPIFLLKSEIVISQGTNYKFVSIYQFHFKFKCDIFLIYFVEIRQIEKKIIFFGIIYSMALFC